MFNLLRGIMSAALAIGAVVLIAWGPRGRVPIDSDRILITCWEKWTGFEGAQQAGMRDRLFLTHYERACEYHQELFALPLTPSTIALFDNFDLHEEYADELRAQELDPARAPRSITELEAYADVLHRVNNADEIEMLTHLTGTAGSFAWFWQSWPIYFGGTLRPLWVPAGFAGAFNVFLLRQFFRQIPRELCDAGRIDGLLHWGISWRIATTGLKI